MYSIKNLKTGAVLYLHRKPTLKKDGFVYYFSKDPTDAIELPLFLEVVYNSSNGHPFVRKRDSNER